MNERFKLAATLLLQRRLKSFIPINNNIEIDKNYITYAEYQLFINDMKALGKNRQPERWIMDKFSPENAKKPIVGVRASDAQEFCEWLNNKYPLLGYKYRLPTLEEIAIKPSLENQIGCWCIDENQLIIGGINSEQWQIWQEKLKNLLKFEEDIGQYSYFNLDDILAWEINLNVDFSSQHFQIVTLAQELSVILIYEFNKQSKKYAQSSSIYTLRKNLINTLINISDLIFISPVKFLFNISIDFIDSIHNFIFSLSLFNRKNTTNSSLEEILKATNETISRFNENISRFDELFTRFSSQQENIIHTDYQLQRNQHEAIFSAKNSTLKFLDSINFDFNCMLDLDLNLDSAFVNVLNRHQNCNSNDLKCIRYYLLVCSICWSLLGSKYEKKSSNFPLSSYEYYSSALKDKKQAKKYMINKNIFLNSYSFFVLLENRINGSMPCWEGIRIVREKIKYK